jgi:glycosyltransferase involved in cell wall biosynthesis
LNEAMASARPVIASSKVGGARDLVEGRQDGWTFKSRDRLGLESALKAAVAQGREGLARLGAVAQARCAGWSTQTSARCIGDAVLTCVAGSRR